MVAFGPKGPRRKIVLVDDDLAFCSIMSSYATSMGVDLEYFNSCHEMGSIGKLGEYSLAIVDYDLGEINGIEIAEYLPIFFGDMPMILISGKIRVQGEKAWPISIRKFLHKDLGPDRLITEACQLAGSPGKNIQSNDFAL